MDRPEDRVAEATYVRRRPSAAVGSRRTQLTGADADEIEPSRRRRHDANECTHISQMSQSSGGDGGGARRR